MVIAVGRREGGVEAGEDRGRLRRRRVEIELGEIAARPAAVEAVEGDAARLDLHDAVLPVSAVSAARAYAPPAMLPRTRRKPALRSRSMSQRSEERRVGNGCASTFRSRVAPYL